jgi:hypothetical protein
VPNNEPKSTATAVTGAKFIVRSNDTGEPVVLVVGLKTPSVVVANGGDDP